MHTKSDQTLQVAAPFKVGDLARETGKTVRALRLYEELGLLEPTGRTKGRFRLYQIDAVRRVEWISNMQVLGFTLPKIKELLLLQENGGAGGLIMGEVRSVYAKKLKETQDSIARLSSLEKELIASLAYLENCNSCRFTNLPHDCETQCTKNDQAHAPDLVKGLNAKEYARGLSLGVSS